MQGVNQDNALMNPSGSITDLGSWVSLSGCRGKLDADDFTARSTSAQLRRGASVSLPGFYRNLQRLAARPGVCCSHDMTFMP